MKLTKEQINEIKEQQSQESSTKRVTAPDLEKILYEAIPILDHGFIRVVDYMGNDSSVVQSARVSYGKGTKKVSTDSGLIKYLMRHWHSTPFEMCEIKYHVKLPIFIARQWIRHRTANVNEYSARYSILDKEFYLPKNEHLAAQSKSNRQGRGQNLEGDQAKKVLELLKNDAERTYENYETMLNERYDGSVIDEKNVGLARELARMNLTLNTYTQWYWKTDLLNLMNFLRLRADHHAQYEIRAYANVMLDTLKKWVPITYDAFMDYRVGGTEVSSKGKILIQKLINGEKIDIESSGLSKREWNELMTSFNLKDKIV
ncbi:MAG: thymidylate synthase (FAD) [Candidatus Pelagibacter sp. TMED166]|jgi:thymidylate synthase (FAD)|nr:MAG: thymidylate synthase (FAD) [Candidatus Pelagibacter sp. TMED166]|tara:strand:- start:397 stop:1344 length:948 start_codon:yes stop_codon:yes gene_type:complete